MSSKLRRTVIATILAMVAIAVSAGPALASTGTVAASQGIIIKVPVGSVAGGLGVAAIAGIGLMVAQRRRRRTISTKR